MSTVYRVEHPDCGHGPFNCFCNEKFHAFIAEHPVANEHPTLIEDLIPIKVKTKLSFEDLYSAVNTKRGIRQWFYDIYPELRKAEFKLAVYKLVRAFPSFSGKQVFFTKNGRIPTYRGLP